MTELTEQIPAKQSTLPKSKGKLQNRITLLLIAILIPILLLFAWFDITSQRNNLEALLLERAESTATSGAVTIGSFLEHALESGQLSRDDIFDTDYQEFWQFNPTAYPDFDGDPATLTKYHTAYDTYTDEHLQELLDSFLSGEDIIFAVAADKNGYVPTHNTGSSSGDGNPATDRTKRIFNDPVGLKAVQNTEPIIQQIYQQAGTGETFWDVSAPIYVDGEHWGAFRVGIELSQNQERVIAATWQIIFAMSLVVVLVAIFSLIVGRYISAPIVKLTSVATLVAGGDLNQQATIHNRQEISTLAQAFNSMTRQLRDFISNLETRVAARTQDLELASEISQNVSQIRDINKLTTTAVSLIQQRFNLYHVQLYLADAEQTTLTLLASTGEVGQQMLDAGHKLTIDDNSLNGRAALEKEPVLVSDTAARTDFKPHSLLPNTRSETAVPLIVDTNVVGVLDLQSDKPNTFNEESLPTFVTLAGQLAIAIENSNLFAESDHQAKRLSALNEMSAAIATAIDINEIYKAAGQYTQQIVGGQRASLGILDPDGQTFEVLGLSGEKGAIPLGTHLPVSKTAVGLCIQEGKLVIDGDGHPEKYADIQKLTEQGLLSTISAPLTVGNKVIGTLNVGSNQANAFGAPERSLIQQITSLLSGAIENRQLLAQAQKSLASVKENESLMRTIIDSTPDWIFIKNTQHRYQLVNQSYAEAMGLTTETFIGKNDLEIGFPEEIVKGNPEKGIRGFWADDQEIMDNGEIKIIDEEPAIVDDEPRVLSTIKVPLKDNENNVTGIVGFVHDITVIKQAEATIAKQAVDLQTVAEISTQVSAIEDPQEMLEVVVQETQKRFGLYHCHVFLMDDAGKDLRIRACGWHQDATEYGTHGTTTLSMDLQQSLVVQAARSRQAVVVNDVLNDPHWLPNELLPDTRSELAVPLIVGNKVLGVLDVQATEVDHFTANDIKIQSTLAAQVAVALENAHAFEQVSQQEEILRQRDLQLAQANELAGMATWEFDLKNQTFTFNDQYYTLLGTTLADVGSYQLPASDFLEMFVYPEDAQSIIDEITTALAQTNPDFLGHIDFRLVDANKKLRHVQNEYRLNFDDQGQPAKALGYILDITERREAEEVIQRNQTLLRTIIDSTPDWIFVKDNQHRYQMVNKAYADSTHLESDALIGKTILDIGLPQEIAETLLAEDEALMESEETMVVSEEEILLDGETRYQTITKVLLRDASGQVQSLVGFAHDVTRQVTAAEEQKNLQQELEAQLERVNALQRAMTRESWQAFMTTTAGKRPFQGFEFNQAGIKTLTAQDITNGKNKEAGSSTPNGNNEIITPVKIQDTTIGKIGVRNSDGTPISEEKRSLLISLTAQVAEALDRARLFEETELGRQEIELQAAELSTVNEISELVSTQLNINDLLNAVGDRLIETFSADSVYIALVDEKTSAISFPYFTNIIDGPVNMQPRTLDNKGGFTAQIYQTQQPIIHNLIADNLEIAITEVGGEAIESSQDSNSYIGIPMTVGTKVIGVIGINGQQDRRMYDENDIPLLTTLSSTIAIALQNAQQFEDTQRRANREAMVNEISQKIQSAPTIEKAMQTAVAELGKALNLKHAVVKLNKPDNTRTE